MIMSLDGVRIGLKDLYYATLISDASDGATYNTPVQIVGAITANINPNSTNATLFADDGPMETASQLGLIELEMNAADIPLSVQKVLLGADTMTSGVLLKKSTDVPPWVAIGFRSIKSNGNYRYVWLVKGKFREPELNHETKGDAINFQTLTLNGQFVKREYDEVWYKSTDEDGAGYADVSATWFAAGGGPDAP
jgi:phi13 family phage major tail protein